MAYFPKIGPFYDPGNEHEFYGEQDGRLRLRNVRERRDSGNGESIRESRNSNNRSKVGWSDLVQDQSNIFYTEPNRQADSNGNNNNGAKIELNNNHSRQGSSQSDSIDSPRQFLEGRLGRNFERQGSGDSRHSVHSSRSVSSVERGHHIDHGNISANVQTLDRSAFDRQDRQRLSDPSYATFSKYLDSNTSSPVTSQRLHLKTDQRNIGGMSSGTACQSGKRKSVLLVPNTKGLTEVTNYTGVELCEKLFGIKLCNYKQRPQQPPNGSSIEQVLRERKVIVQSVVTDSQADICCQIHRGDMLVGLNDIDVTWVNIEDLLRQLALSTKVKLTFQVPLVIGPKQSTPPVTPTHSTPSLPPHLPHNFSHNSPPVPPHLPRRIPITTPVPPRPPPPAVPKLAACQDIVSRTTGESLNSILESLRRHLFAVIYLTFAGQTEESKEDVVYQFPFVDNKLVETRGLFHTLSALLPDVTSNCPKITCIKYKGNNINVGYWRHERDVLLICLPETRVSSYSLLHAMSNIIRVIKVLYGSVIRVFHDRELHANIDQLFGLTLYKMLLTGVMPQTLPPCSPLEPSLIDSMAGVRWLRLNHDDKILCDEILSEYEAQDFNDLDEIEPDERRQFGVVGSCLYFKDYLICSHLRSPDLQDVHLFLLHHCVLHLVNREPVEDLVIWQEVYPTYLCHTERPDVPGYREPSGRWFLLVTGMRHFLHCTLFETGSYASHVSGGRQADRFCVDQSRATLGQLFSDDTDLEHQCTERLFCEKMRPTLKCIGSDRQVNRQTSQTGDGSLLKSPVGKLDGSPKYDDFRKSPDAHTLMKRQVSHGSIDSSGSSNSAGLHKGVSPNKKGSMYDMSILNRSFGDKERKPCDIKLTRGSSNTLLHYAHFDQCDGVYVCPRPGELSNVEGPTHQHVLFNFYSCCLKIRKMFEEIIYKKRHTGPGSPHGQLEEAVMFTCHVGGQQDAKKPPSVFIYWVIGRLSPDKREMFVCIEDGAPQSMLELAFSYNCGIT